MRYPTEQEIENLQQQNTDDAVWAVAELLGNLPADFAGEAWAAMAHGLTEAGFEAFFKTETGLRVLWVRRSS